MFSKEESAVIRKEFWTSFGKSFPRRWLLYNTKIKGVSFKFVANRKNAMICLDIVHSDEIANEILYDQILSLKTILIEELKTFKWNELDRYPTFKTCDASIDFQETKSCFEQTVVMHISNYFQANELVVNQKVSDTILMDFLVTNIGNINISYIQSQLLTKDQIPNLDSIIGNSLASLPKLYPAIKRSQQVQAAFQIPLILVVK